MYADVMCKIKPVESLSSRIAETTNNEMNERNPPPYAPALRFYEVSREAWN